MYSTSLPCSRDWLMGETRTRPVPEEADGPYGQSAVSHKRDKNEWERRREYRTVPRGSRSSDFWFIVLPGGEIPLVVVFYLPKNKCAIAGRFRSEDLYWLGGDGVQRYRITTDLKLGILFSSQIVPLCKFQRKKYNKFNKMLSLKTHKNSSTIWSSFSRQNLINIYKTALKQWNWHFVVLFTK